MPYPVIPSNLKNVESVYLKIMSSDEMIDMSYGQVLLSETINYRTGVPQTNGLFCQAIFGPIKDYECACGKYKRYRYAGVVCDKCGVMVAPASVRRERMGHIDLAAPAIHPWFLRIIPSRVALLLEMKSIDISRICYFSAYAITEINEDMREEYTARINEEHESRVKSTKSSFDKKFEELGRQYQIDKTSDKFNPDELKAKYEADKEIMKIQQAEMLTKIETVAQMAKKELTSLQIKDVISENVHQELAQKFGPVFKAEIGAEAIESLLGAIDLQAEYEAVKTRLQTVKSQVKKKLVKKLQLIKHFLDNDTSPTWMVLKRIMVLPPDLRPMLQLDGGRFAASDLNDLYRKLINRNNRLRKLIHIGAPEVILRNEKRMLQEAVEALIDNTVRNGKQVMSNSGAKRPLKSLTDALKGKGGRFRQNLLGKRVDYSGRSVIIIGPTLNLDQCGLPKEMALELFKPFLIGRIIAKSEKGLLKEEHQCFNIHSARRLIETGQPIIFDILDEVIQDKYVLLNRAPTLHRLGFLAFKPVLIEGRAIQVHPMVCRGFNADFDGDQMAVHLPITVKGQDEARQLMSAPTNLLKPATGKLIMSGHQDIHLGAYYLTHIEQNSDSKNKSVPTYSSPAEAMYAYQLERIKINELVKIRFNSHGLKNKIIETSIGRMIFNGCFPDDYTYINDTINKKNYDNILGTIFHDLGQPTLALILDKIKDTMFKYATSSGISISVSDLVQPKGKEKIILEAQEKVTKIQKFHELGFLNDEDKHRQIINLWRKTSEVVADMSKNAMDKTNNVGIMINSGARGTDSQVNFMCGMRGLTQASSGEMIELPATHGYIEGLSPLEYFISMKGHRKGMAGTALQTADAGYLTRRLVDVAQNAIITQEDCGTSDGIFVNKANSIQINCNFFDRVYGRYLAQDLVHEGNILAKAGELIGLELLSQIKQKDIDNIWIRSVVKCQLARGICKKCYGIDLSTHREVALGTPVGVIGAQSMGEPATQLAVSSIKQGVAAGAKSDITAGLPRVEEILESRTPKYHAMMAVFDGIVDRIEGSLDQGFKVVIRSIESNTYISDKANFLLEGLVEGDSVNTGDLVGYDEGGNAIIANTEGTIRYDKKGNISLTQQAPKQEEYISLPGIYLTVKAGQMVKKGQILSEGAIDLQVMMDLVGMDAVQHYITQELNAVYVSNGIEVGEKHIEVIIRQMCSRVHILESGNSDFTSGDVVRLSSVLAINSQLISKNLKPAIYKRLVIGISRASLSTDSFLSAASFQETARVLVEAALSSRKDNLVGLKENVILGQLIPCGTAFNYEKVTQLNEVQEEYDEIEASGED
jgi:DNA-directed RNA polymerase subunit beta'